MRHSRQEMSRMMEKHGKDGRRSRYWRLEVGWNTEKCQTRLRQEKSLAAVSPLSPVRIAFEGGRSVEYEPSKIIDGGSQGRSYGRNVSTSYDLDNVVVIKCSSLHRIHRCANPHCRQLSHRFCRPSIFRACPCCGS